MAKKTLTQRIEQYLLSFCTELHSSNKKYRLFKQNKDILRYYHLGQRGAVRTSTTGRITDAASVSDHMEQYLLAWERDQNGQ